jgi:organic radical activating enzyme
MNIQTISIVVPTKGCVNNCPFCVSHMHDSPYEYKWDEVQMRKRIQYAVMNDVNTCIITGTGEPFQNQPFLDKLYTLFVKMGHPFPNIELQTTGVFLSKETDLSKHIIKKDGTPTIIHECISLLHAWEINTVSLSVANIFDDGLNNKIMGVPEKLRFYLYNLIALL